MERLVNCDILINIAMIDNISGANRSFEVIFTSKNKMKYKIVFNQIWDMRYSIENASIDRWYQFRKCLPIGLIDNSIYMVEDSEYIKYLEKQLSGTLPIKDVKHYILSDNIDSTLDVLTLEKPVLIKI